MPSLVSEPRAKLTMDNVLILSATHVMLDVSLHFSWILLKVSVVAVDYEGSDERESKEGWWPFTCGSNPASLKNTVDQYIM